MFIYLIYIFYCYYVFSNCIIIYFISIVVNYIFHLKLYYVCKMRWLKCLQLLVTLRSDLYLDVTSVDVTSEPPASCSCCLRDVT